MPGGIREIFFKIYRFVQNKRFQDIFFIAVLAIIIFTFTSKFFFEPDIWYHLKTGEISVKQGILHHDIFSQAGPTRESFPTDWLFEGWVYYLWKFTGFVYFGVFTGLLSIVQVLAMYLLLRKIFRLNALPIFILCILYFAGTFPFFLLRPQLIAVSFYILELIILLLYFIRGKNLLFLLIPLIYIWSNSNPSVVLGVITTALFTGISVLNYFIYRDNKWFGKGYRYLLFTVLVSVASILPPAGLTQYRVLLLNENYKYLNDFITEALPLYEASKNEFIMYTCIAAVISIICAVLFIKKKLKPTASFLFPFAIVFFLGYVQSKFRLYGILVSTIIFGWIWTLAGGLWKTVWRKLLLGAGIALLLYFAISKIFFMDVSSHKYDLFYPDQAVKFLKAHKIQGNMFNWYDQGSYLIYHLYPDYKVFTDTRGYVHLCCELKSQYDLYKNSWLPDTEYKKLVDKIFGTYNISYAILPITNQTIMAQISQLLLDDPNWVLVFWDDHTFIFVKNNKLNDGIISEFGARSVRPFRTPPYIVGQENKAFSEVTRMLTLSDSALSHSMLGMIYVKQNRIAEAKKELTRALAISQTDVLSMEKLGDIAILEKDYRTAFDYYSSIYTYIKDRSIVYLRLGELTLDLTGDRNMAMKYWQAGIANSVDEDGKAVLRDRLRQYSIQ